MPGLAPSWSLVEGKTLTQACQRRDSGLKVSKWNEQSLLKRGPAAWAEMAWQ